MKKANWSSSIFAILVLILAGCTGSESGNSGIAGGNEKSSSLAAPPPGSTLEATGVHEISYGVLKFLANGYNSCNCVPSIDTMFFGNFISKQAIQQQIDPKEKLGVYLHLCLNASDQFYLALSGSEGLGDSTLNSGSYYPVGSGSYTFKASSVDNLFDAEVFTYPGDDSLTGSVIMTDRARFASKLTCDLNGDNTQDSLATVPYGFINRGELEELLTQSSAPYMALMMGYDPTMYPSVMRVLLASTKPNGTNLMKLVKMDPTNATQYALFLERTRP